MNQTKSKSPVLRGSTALGQPLCQIQLTNFHWRQETPSTPFSSPSSLLFPPPSPCVSQLQRQHRRRKIKSKTRRIMKNIQRLKVPYSYNTFAKVQQRYCLILIYKVQSTPELCLTTVKMTVFVITLRVWKATCDKSHQQDSQLRDQIIKKVIVWSRGFQNGWQLSPPFLKILSGSSHLGQNIRL